MLMKVQLESEFGSTEVTTGPARRRVLQWLARLHRHRDAQALIWPPRRDQMGDRLNITIETCSRALSALRREGVLELMSTRHGPDTSRPPSRLRSASAPRAAALSSL
jgi:CRP-like cAMP-binding protein